MNLQEKRLYEFGPFRLDTHEHVLLRDKEVVPLAPKALDLLIVLVEQSGHVLSKDELMKQVLARQLCRRSKSFASRLHAEEGVGR